MSKVIFGFLLCDSFQGVFERCHQRKVDERDCKVFYSLPTRLRGDLFVLFFMEDPRQSDVQAMRNYSNVVKLKTPCWLLLVTITTIVFMDFFCIWASWLQIQDIRYPKKRLDRW